MTKEISQAAFDRYASLTAAANKLDAAITRAKSLAEKLLLRRRQKELRETARQLVE